ncbi:hypothetical protein CR513_34051, partial [Mucuna pruriens]
MDVKTTFLNDDIHETIYMMQFENFVSNDSKSMICKLKKSIYGLKQASCQWYHKFHQVITLYGFETNVVGDCVYHKFNRNKNIFLACCMEPRDSNEEFLDKKSWRNFFCIGDSDIERSFSRYPKCPNNNLERNKMQKIPYASTLGSLTYVQVCTCPDIVFVVRALSKYLSEPRMQHWKIVKHMMNYLKKTNGYVLTYWKFEGLEIIKYFNSNFVGCQDSKHPRLDTFICWLEELSLGICSLLLDIQPQDMTVKLCHLFARTSCILVDPLTKGLIPK